jgi:capsular polysaccharide biosynthesis protein
MSTSHSEHQQRQTNDPMAGDPDETEDSIHLLDLVFPLAQRWRMLLVVPSLAAFVAGMWAFLVEPTFTARTTFLPPQQQQSAGAAALASLGTLAGLAGASGIRTPADQLVSLLQSNAVRDPIIDGMGLMAHYEVEYRTDARRQLDREVRISVGKRDGLVTIEADGRTPEQAAELANRHVVELRRVTGELALSEAQQRRAFFEIHVRQTHERLMKAQAALESSGVTAGALRAEPRVMADSYGAIRAQITAAEVRLAALKRNLADRAPEVLQQVSTLTALREQLARIEAVSPAPSNEGYLGRFREFKYQEALFELFARQYELARVDESKEGALIQVVDAATPPERRSRPRRAVLVVSTWGLTLLLTSVTLMTWGAFARTLREPSNAARWSQLRRSIGLQ